MSDPQSDPVRNLLEEYNREQELLARTCHVQKKRIFKYPNNCCSCLGPAEKMLDMKIKIVESQRKTIITFDVPVCKKCYRRIYLLRSLGWAIFIVSFPGGLALSFLMGMEDPTIMFVAAASGGFGIKYLIKKTIEPARWHDAGILGGYPEFLNKEYQTRFLTAGHSGLRDLCSIGGKG